MTKFRINQKGLLRSDVSRRNFMGLAGGAAAGLAMSSRGVWAQEATDEFKGKELNVLTWPGHGDPYMVGAFEERYGVRARVKEYVGGDQLLAVIDSTPQGVYEVILDDAAVVEQHGDAEELHTVTPAD